MGKPEPGALKAALIGALLFSCLAMSPVLSHFSSHKFGPNLSGVGSDSYGFLYSMWLAQQPSDGRVRSDTMDLLSGYPAGRPLSFHIQIGSGLAYQLAKVGVPPVACYNFVIWLWFSAAFFCGFWIFHQLGTSRNGALLGAFVVGFLPYQSLQAVDHIDLAMTWPILLDIVLLKFLLVDRKAWPLPLLILNIGLSVFSHPYYLICTALMNGLPLFCFGSLVLRREAKITRAQWGQIAAALIAAAGIVLFWKSLFTTDVGGIDNLERDLRDLYMYSTKIWDFVLPPHYSFPFSSITTAFKTQQTMQTGSNFVENTLYPGILVLLGVPLGLSLHLRKSKKNMKKWTAANRGVILLLISVTLVPTLLSMSPTIDVFGFAVPTLTRILYVVLPQFRTMSRFGYVSSVGLVMIFVLLIDAQIAKRKTVTALLALLFCVDLGYLHQDFYSDTLKVPQAYTYLRDSTPETAVIFEVPYMWGYLTTFWQTYHKRRNFAVFEAGNPNFRAMVETSRMDLPNLLRFCKSNKIDYLLIHLDNLMQLPGVHFENQTDLTWIHFLFGRYSYVIKVADVSLKKFLVNLFNAAAERNRNNILALAGERPAEQFLDLGCDDGVWTLTVAKRVAAKDVHGVEINSVAAEQAGKNGVHVTIANLKDPLPFKNSMFDLVHTNQVIEHVPDVDLFTKEIFRVLKPGGRVVLSTENGSSWHNIFASILGWQIFSLTNMSALQSGVGNPLALHRGTQEFSSSWTHKVIFNYRGLIEFLELHGFRDIHTKGSGYYPLPAIFGDWDPRHAHFLTLSATAVKS